jgi:hypothetical protein
MENLWEKVKSSWQKPLIFVIFVVVAWNVTKIPFYIAFDADGDTAYEKGGLEGSINLSMWINVSSVQLQNAFPSPFRRESKRCPLFM